MRTLGVLTVLTVVLSACGPPRPPPVDFNPANAKVTSIALLDPGIPERPMLRYVGSASGVSIIGTMLGPIGAVATLPIERAAHERIQTEFATVVAARPLNVREELAGGLERSLREHGYNVVRVPVSRPLKGDRGGGCHLGQAGGAGAGVWGGGEAWAGWERWLSMGGGLSRRRVARLERVGHGLYRAA